MFPTLEVRLLKILIWWGVKAISLHVLLELGYFAFVPRIKKQPVFISRDWRDFLIWNFCRVPGAFWYVTRCKNTSQRQSDLKRCNISISTNRCFYLLTRLIYRRFREGLPSFQRVWHTPKWIRQTKEEAAMYRRPPRMPTCCNFPSPGKKQNGWQARDPTNYRLVCCRPESVATPGQARRLGLATHRRGCGAPPPPERDFRTPRFPQFGLFYTALPLPLILPRYAAGAELPWVVSRQILRHQCLSPPVAFWGDSYQLCSYTHLTTLLAGSDSAAEHLHGAHALPQTIPPL